MKELIEKYKSEIKSYAANSQDELENFRIKFVSKKSVINDLFEDFRQIPADEKRFIGPALNELKNLAMDKLKDLSNALDSNKSSNANLSSPIAWPPPITTRKLKALRQKTNIAELIFIYFHYIISVFIN